MYAEGPDELLCDMAETYRVYDLQALPTETIATLASGLSPDSRIKRKMSGVKATSDILLLAAAVDRLSFLAWTKTKDAQHNRNRPSSILAELNKTDREETEEAVAFDSPEAFLEARAKVIEGG